MKKVTFLGDGSHVDVRITVPVAISVIRIYDFILVNAGSFLISYKQILWTNTESLRLKSILLAYPPEYYYELPEIN